MKKRTIISNTSGQDSQDLSHASDGTYLSQSQFPSQQYQYEIGIADQKSQAIRNTSQSKSYASIRKPGTAMSGMSDDTQSQASMFSRKTVDVKKSAFSSAYGINSRNIPQLNKEHNFMPVANVLSSTELLHNSMLKNKIFTDNDSTRATILYEENYSINDTNRIPSPLHKRLEAIMEENAFQQEREDRMKNPVYNFKPLPEEPIRRASQIAADTQEYMANEKQQPKVVEKSVVFSPYDITSQNELNLIIEKDRKKREIENDYNARVNKEISNKNAVEILSFLGMNVPEIQVLTEDNENENTDQDFDDSEMKQRTKQKKKTVIDPALKKDAQNLGVGEIIEKMNAFTPDQQKLAIILSARGKAANTRANFQEEDKEVNKRKINLISDGIKKQIELDAKKAEEDAAAAALAKAKAQVRGRGSQNELSDIEEENDKKSQSTSKQKIPRIIDRNVINKSFHYQNKYQSNIYTRVFDKLGLNYVSKYLSKSTFDILDGHEEDPDQTVIYNANYGQKVLFIENKTPLVKPILIKGGKFRNPIFIPEDATQEEINEAQYISTKTYRQIERLRMTIPASIESQKEKDYSMYGRSHRMKLQIPRSHWEEKMVEAGRRKVRFNQEYDLIQYELHHEVETIFKDPEFFNRPKVQAPSRQKEHLMQLGLNESTFQGIDSEAPKINQMDIPLDRKDKKKFFQVFDEQFLGQDVQQSAFQKEWSKFASFKEMYQGEFDRLDGFKYNYKQKDSIVAGIRNGEMYDSIIAEEGEKKWRPPDEPQTNPPEVLKEFQIEPNILVYSKNILDIDMNYKNKDQGKKDGRRQGRIGLADSGSQAYQVQLIAENKEPQENDPLSILGSNEEKEEKDSPHIRQRGGNVVPADSNQNMPGLAVPPSGGLSLMDSILKFQQLQALGQSGISEGDLKQLAGHGTILPQHRKRDQFDFMFENPANLPFAQMTKIQRAVDETEKQLVKLNEAEQAMYDATPMIPVNVFSQKSFFRIHEVEEFEKEMRAMLKKDVKPSAEQTQKEKIEAEMQRQKALQQMNQMVAALNPINFQFTGKDLKSRTILQGLDSQILSETTKSKLPIVTVQQKPQVAVPVAEGNEKKTEQPQPPKTADSKKSQVKPSEVPPSTAQSKSNLIKSQTEISLTTEKTNKTIPKLRLSQVEGENDDQAIEKNNQKEQKPQFAEYGSLLELKTIQDLNEMQAATSSNIIQKTQKKMNIAQMKADNYQYGNLNPLHTTGISHASDESIHSSISNGTGFKKGNRTVVKNSYLADYGSYLLNSQLDYNTPNYYHQREAEQGLFYLSKHYRDYFEPARDTFADKEGWDILDKFAQHPKNKHAPKATVYNYAEPSKNHETQDILTAFQGLQAMHEYNKVTKDVNTRNETNLKRKIVYNQL